MFFYITIPDDCFCSSLYISSHDLFECFIKNTVMSFSMFSLFSLSVCVYEWNMFTPVFAYNFASLNTYLSFSICLKAYTKNQAEVVVAEGQPNYLQLLAHLNQAKFLARIFKMISQNLDVGLKLKICIFKFWSTDLHLYLFVCFFPCLIPYFLNCFYHLKSIVKN